MAIAELETAICRVQEAYKKTTQTFDASAKALMRGPCLVLSRLLTGVLGLSGRPMDNKAVSSCVALELLEQALALGESVATQKDYDEEKLLITDYLYGQAIGRVIDIEEPAVIKILARAISESAEQKAVDRLIDKRSRLVIAAFDIAMELGEFTLEERASVIGARDGSSGLDADRLKRLPAGSARDWLLQSVCVVTAN